MQIRHWLDQASAKLSAFDTAHLDADLLMCHVLQCDRTRLYARPEQVLGNEQLVQLDALLERRVRGEPIAYLTGKREFWSLNFAVNTDVLVPRPETELLVELALQELHRNGDGPVLDAGTGSGAIAIALFLQWQKDKNESLRVIASDISEAALAVAKRNACALNAEPVEFVRSNWLSEFPDSSIGMIVSNPPYLAASDPHLQNATLGFEPDNALVGGTEGLDAIKTIVQQASRVAKPDCRVLIEHGHTQGDDVQNLMRAANFSQVQTFKDINELERVTTGFCPKN